VNVNVKHNDVSVDVNLSRNSICQKSVKYDFVPLMQWLLTMAEWKLHHINSRQGKLCHV